MRITSIRLTEMIRYKQACDKASEIGFLSSTCRSELRNASLNIASMIEEQVNKPENAVMK